MPRPYGLFDIVMNFHHRRQKTPIARHPTDNGIRLAVRPWAGVSHLMLLN